MKTINLCFSAALLLFSCKKESNTSNLPLDTSVATYTPTGTLNNGLVAYYPFSGNANDVTTNSNHGTVYGCTLTTDRFGEANKAYAFNGSSNYIRIPYSTSLDIRNDFSISVWVNPDTNTLTYGTHSFLVQHGDAQAGHDPFTLTYDVVKKCSAISVNSGDGTVSNLTYMPDNLHFQNIWTHVTATCNKTTNTLKIYANGLLVNSTVYPDLSLSYATNNSGFYVYLGCTEIIHSLFKGSLDEVRIYNREISAAEALELAFMD